MTNFKHMSGEDIIEELSFTGPVAGESLTMPIRKMPYDRPPDSVDAQELLERIFYQLGKPKMIRKVMGLLRAGISIDMVVAPMLAQLSGEGKTSPYVAMLAAPAVTVMLARMAEAAGIDYKISSGENNFLDEDEIMSGKLLFSNNNKENNAKRINEMSSKELVDKSKKISLMQRPKGLV